jgi:BMFP domain-containing protein YqiC
MCSSETLQLRNQEAAKYRQQLKALQDRIVQLESEATSSRCRAETLEAELKLVRSPRVHRRHAVLTTAAGAGADS